MWRGRVFVLPLPALPSGSYISIAETLEKAVAAEVLPLELRSLGFGILACANAVGDMVSSLHVGFLPWQGSTLRS